MRTSRGGLPSLSGPLDHALEERTNSHTGCEHPAPGPAAFLSSCFHVPVCVGGDHSLCESHAKHRKPWLLALVQQGRAGAMTCAPPAPGGREGHQY